MIMCSQNIFRTDNPEGARVRLMWGYDIKHIDNTIMYAFWSDLSLKPVQVIYENSYSDCKIKFFIKPFVLNWISDPVWRQNN